jgi:hypothetical protein
VRAKFGGLLLTCEAVLTEAMFLMRQIPGGRAAVMEMVDDGLFDSGMSRQRTMSKQAMRGKSFFNASNVNLLPTLGYTDINSSL